MILSLFSHLLSLSVLAINIICNLVCNWLKKSSWFYSSSLSSFTFAYLLKEWCEREYECVHVIIGFRPLFLITLCRATHPTPFRPLWCNWDSAAGGWSGNYCPHFTAGESEAYVFPTSLSPKPASPPPHPPAPRHTYHKHIHTRLQFQIFNVRAQEQQYGWKWAPR